MLDAIIHITDDNFYFRSTALCVQPSSTAAALSTNIALIILSEKCDFRIFPFCQVVQKHKLFEVA